MSRYLWLAVTAACIWACCTATRITDGCKIAIMDFNNPAFGLPTCDEDVRCFMPRALLVSNFWPTVRRNHIAVVSNGGVVQNPQKDHALGITPGLESHKYSQASGPYWLAEAIKASPRYTTDVEAATAVLAYDYCQMSWLVAAGFGGGSADGLDPMLVLLHGYKHLLKTQRFQRHNGSDFAVFAPHPVIGPAFEPSLYCDHLGRAFHLVVEAPQRLGCTNASDDYLVVPYSSPKFAEQSSKQTTVARNLTAFFMAACTDDMTYKVRDFGMKMRLHMVQRLQADPAPDLFVKCANEQRMPYEELQEHMRRSTFCLLPPGGTASSRRLTDVVLSGSIPVFVGPPWHAMPLARHVNYSAFAVFINVQSTKFLYGGQGIGMWDKLEVTPFSNASSVFDPVFWFPDVNISQVALDVKDMAELPARLRAIPAAEVRRMQAHLAEAQPFFRYRRKADELAREEIRTASDVIMEEMCERGRAAMRSAGAATVSLPSKRPHSLIKRVRTVTQKDSSRAI